ncbi:MAG: hypothetical protein IJL03_09220 [Lachnospiraceae bacterium]|nr:hypothetical protein [Lachnospiraceae bacterium]
MSLCNTFDIAGHAIEINSIYNRVLRRCSQYSSAKEPEIRIITSLSDIISEKNTSDVLISDKDYETLAVQRKLSEALIDYDTILFHASALAVDGKGYLFTALSGTGKSTHARLWREAFGDRVTMINDDKPFIHIGEDEVRVYGSPWDGKHHLSTNTSVPVKAICILTRDTTNHIEKISADEAFSILLQQTYRSKDPAKIVKTIDLLIQMTKQVSLYRLGCNMDPEAAIVSYEGMNHDS